MKKKFYSIILATFLMITLIFGLISCGASGSVSKDYFAEENYAGDSGAPEGDIKLDYSSDTSSDDGLKIIKTADITAETQEYDKDTEKLKALITSVGGHISNSNANENASYNSEGKPEKNATYTIKVPAEQFDAFVSGISDIFNVTKLSTSTEDVSESYFTLKARIETLQAKREGLVAMLKNVNVNTDFATWQKINSELTDIDTQINIYNEQLQALENKISYSTINLSVREVIELTETEEKGYGERVADAFKDSFNTFVEVLKELLLVLIYLLPGILVIVALALLGIGFIAILAGIITAVIKRMIKRKNKNKSDKA